jgi:hypothetical protein
MAAGVWLCMLQKRDLTLLKELKVKAVLKLKAVKFWMWFRY